MLRYNQPLKERNRSANPWRKRMLMLVLTISVFAIPPACPYSQPILPYGVAGAAYEASADHSPSVWVTEN